TKFNADMILKTLDTEKEKNMTLKESLSLAAKNLELGQLKLEQEKALLLNSIGLTEQEYERLRAIELQILAGEPISDEDQRYLDANQQKLDLGRERLGQLD